MRDLSKRGSPVLSSNNSPSVLRVSLVFAVLWLHPPLSDVLMFKMEGCSNCKRDPITCRREGDQIILTSETLSTGRYITAKPGTPTTG